MPMSYNKRNSLKFGVYQATFNGRSVTNSAKNGFRGACSDLVMIISSLEQLYLADQPKVLKQTNKSLKISSKITLRDWKDLILRGS